MYFAFSGSRTFRAEYAKRNCKLSSRWREIARDREFGGNGAVPSGCAQQANSQVVQLCYDSRHSFRLEGSGCVLCSGYPLRSRPAWRYPDMSGPQEQKAPSHISVPRLWDENELAEMTLPPARHGGEIVYVSSDYFYRMPASNLQDVSGLPSASRAKGVSGVDQEAGACVRV